MSLQFVDTNILLYAYDASAGERHEVARELVSDLGRSRRGAISVQVLQEFYVNATRKVAKPLSPQQAQRRVETLGRWTVHSPVASDVQAAGLLSQRHQLSFWDAMIVLSAERLGCDTLLTEDLNEGQSIGTVLIANPFS